MGRRLGPAVWAVLAAAAVGLETWVSPTRAPVLVAVIAWTLVVGLLAERWLLPAALGALALGLAVPHVLEHVVTAEPVRIYVADLVVGPLLVSGVLRVVARRRLPRLGWHVLAILGFGVIWLALGIARGHSVLDAAGTFRRLCIYPAVFLAGAMAFDGRPFPARAVARLLLVAAGLVSLVALYRLLRGHGYMHAYFTESGGPDRFITFVEAFAPIVAFALLLGDVIQRRRGRWWRVALMAVFLAAIVSSNYRGVWLAFVLAMAAWLIVTRQPMQRSLKISGAVAGLAVLAVIPLFLLAQPSNRPTAKFTTTNLETGMSWRYGSWMEALKVYRQHPLVGVGFGYRHRFQYHTGAGLKVLRTVVGHDIHNDLLWLMVNWGVVGLVLVFGFHARWWYRTAGFTGEDEGRSLRGRVAAAVLVTHLAIVVVAMMQPVFDSPPTAMAIYLLMSVAQASVLEPVAGREPVRLHLATPEGTAPP